jgi:hypothetical protein
LQAEAAAEGELVMGHWGAGPFENDYAADARNAYDKLIAGGLAVEDAVRELQGPKFMTAVHLPEVLRGLAAILAEAERIDPEDAQWVEAMGTPSYGEGNGVIRLVLILASVGCLVPGTARTVLEIVPL